MKTSAYAENLRIIKFQLFVILFIVSKPGLAQINISNYLSNNQLPAYIEKPPAASGIYAIYSGTGIPELSKSWTWHEQSTPIENGKMIRNVALPTVTVFRPAKGKANGTSVIVLPGGAFYVLMMNKEGYDMAKWLTDQGITAFVLKYRVGHMPEKDEDLPAFQKQLFSVLPKVSQSETYPPMSHPQIEEARLWGEEDGRQAIRFIRQHAKELEIDANKIGIMGFSAGGGISVNAALRHDSISRPDFVGAIYAGYRIISPYPHDLPPMFIAIAADDINVAPISSARLFEDWHKLGSSAELHIFANGGHGFGTGSQHLLSDSWLELFKNWLIAKNFLP